MMPRKIVLLEHPALVGALVGTASKTGLPHRGKSLGACCLPATVRNFMFSDQFPFQAFGWDEEWINCRLTLCEAKGRDLFLDA